MKPTKKKAIYSPTLIYFEKGYLRLYVVVFLSNLLATSITQFNFCWRINWHLPTPELVKILFLII